MGIQALQEHSNAGNALDVSNDVKRAPAPDCLLQAAQLVNAAVTRLKGRLTSQLAPEDEHEDWSSTYALTNLYKDGQQGVGAHSGVQMWVTRSKHTQDLRKECNIS